MPKPCLHSGNLTLRDDRLNIGMDFAGKENSTRARKIPNGLGFDRMI